MHEFTPPDRIIFKIWGMWLIAFHSSFYITVIALKKVPRYPNINNPTHPVPTKAQTIPAERIHFKAVVVITDLTTGARG